MREAAFNKLNHEKWKEYEQKIARRGNTHPDELADLFIEVTDDLAFAQTYYPQSKTTQYLNGLAISIHQAIYRNKKERGKRIWQFWKYEIPQAIFDGRRQQLVALIIFVLAIICGIISTLYDEEFVYYVLGPGYVHKTLENIQNGDPLGIYKDEDKLGMFIQIATHNIMVSIITILFGLLLTFGTYVLLLRNGIMLGVFFTFLFKEGVGPIAMLTVWIHGVIEIASIAIAGGAGILMGTSYIFPGSYSRLESFKQGVKIAAKMAVGLVPLFIVAAFLESYVTRYYQQTWVGIVSIGITLPFIIWYYIVYPVRVNKKIWKEK